jgi:hypothetical protein
MEQSPYECSVVPQLVRISVTYYGTQKLITTDTGVSTCFFPEPDESIPLPFFLFRILFNIILLSTPGSSK